MRHSRAGRVSHLIDLTESPDGKTLYFIEQQPHVRREVITNFGERPPL